MFSSATSENLDGSLGQASWDRIARKTRWCPLLYGTPRIVARGETVALASSRQWFFVASIGAMAAGTVFVIAIYPRIWWFFPQLPVPWFLSHKFVAAVALGFAAIAALGLARANRIEFDGGAFPGQLQIVQGTFPFVTRLRARFDELSVQLSVPDDQSDFPGYVVLWLRREDNEGHPIRIAVLEPEQSRDLAAARSPGRNLRAVYSFLAQRVKADDQTVVRLALPEGGEIVAPKTPLLVLSSSDANYRLAFSDADHAAFLPTKSKRRWSLAFFLGTSWAVAFLWISRLAGARNEKWPFLDWIFSFIVFLMMLASVAVLLSRYEVACDRQNLRVRRRKLFPWRSRVQCWPTSSLAAVQICSYGVGSDANYIAHQLNLIFRQPPSDRISLVCHGDAAAIRADAVALAQFLQVPLVDHSRASGGS